ncbi:DUF1963 domain-containing protein [Streptomyces sp. GESEQ-4]|uniref:DUF1963 domain-containing protein n=1 Tax=Streptomyces sp. GESEQ-4 TaxID=2812655 RepID=UPI001FF0BDBE|nr:DUF1963 domain-containing protein [Streptomyces sp. GESEQ-4]
MTFIHERLVHEMADEHGVPGAVAQELMERCRPCVYLVLHEELPPAQRESARPAARTGGLPSLPHSVGWPEGKKPLVLTIDCAALPHDALDIELPADGHLLFFTSIEYEPESSVVLHVPAGVQTTERAATYELDGEERQVKVYEPRTLYPVTGLTLHEDWRDAPKTRSFADSDEQEEVLDRFENAVLDRASSGARHQICVQIGGFSDPWDMAPDDGDLVLLAQIAGQAIDDDVPTMNLIVGTPKDIATQQYSKLQYEQQT